MDNLIDIDFEEALPIILKKHRKKMNLTQGQVADILGINRSAYAYYETNTIPKPNILFRLMYLYQIDLSSFFSDAHEIEAIGGRGMKMTENLFCSYCFLNDLNQKKPEQIAAKSTINKSGIQKMINSYDIKTVEDIESFINIITIEMTQIVFKEWYEGKKEDQRL